MSTDLNSFDSFIVSNHFYFANHHSISASAFVCHILFIVVNYCLGSQICLCSNCNLRSFHILFIYILYMCCSESSMFLCESMLKNENHTQNQINSFSTRISKKKNTFTMPASIFPFKISIKCRRNVPWNM